MTFSKDKNIVDCWVKPEQEITQDEQSSSLRMYFIIEPNRTPSGKKTVTRMQVAWMQLGIWACPPYIVWKPG